MKGALFFLPFLVVAGLGTHQDSFAVEQVTGYNYFDVTNPDGSHTWSTHHPYVLYNDVYVPYIQNDLSVTSTIGTVILNPNGSYDWNGKFTDRIIGKYADITDLNSWTYPNSLNSDTPENTFENDEFASSKFVSGVADMNYKYIFNDGKWKTQLEVTNLSGLTTKVFGFDQIIDLNSDTIKFGGTTRNLDNFDGVTFDKEFLDNNEGKVLDLLNGVNFDFDLGYENLYSITVHDTGVNSSQLVFDYRTSDILLPGETLVIDPTFGPTAGSSYYVYSTAATGTSCDHSPYTKVTAWQVERANSGSSASCSMIAIEFDISAFPSGTTIADVSLTKDVTALAGSGGLSCSYRAMANQPSVSSAATVWSDMKDGTLFYSGDTGCNSISTGQVIDLGAGADADMQAAVDASQAWWSTSIIYDSMTRTAAQYYTTFGTNTIDITITYFTGTPPDAVDDLVNDDLTDTTADFSFSAPGLNGETLQNYTLRIDTPQTSSPSTFNQNSTNLYFNVTSLLPGTGYSAIASAATAGGFNFTGNVVNFTTWEYPDGTLSLATGNIGDTLAANGTLTLTTGTLPIEVDSIKLYQDNSLVKTVSVSETIVSLPDTVSLETLWYRITDSISHEYHLQVTSTNGAGTNTTKSSTNATLAREYTPSYLPAVDSPATQGNVNATVTRFDSEDGLNLKVNRISVSTGDTWQIECIAQTNSQAAQTKNQTASWTGTWSNTTDTGYFNATYTGFTNSHAYITCFNEDELFTLTDFTDSSLALLGIQLFDDSYGSMIGVPVGIFFLVMTAGMANKRTAPTFIILITGIAGTMATIGFFSFEPLVWGLALVTAMLGIFVNQKIF